VSWAPAFPVEDNQASSNLNVKRLVSGGCDNVVKILREDQSGQWVVEHNLEGHNDWVRDVSWSQNVIHTKTNIASCSQVRIKNIF
jgi:protein transport protein SEC13